MKKIIAIGLILVATGWAFYLYGRTDSSDASAGAEAAYERDERLSALVDELEIVRTSIRKQLELLDHAQKNQAARPAPVKSDLPESNLQDPFSANF